MGDVHEQNATTGKWGVRSSTQTTDNSGNPAENVTAETRGISGVYKTYYLEADTAANMSAANKYRIYDATGYKAFRVTVVEPTTRATEELAYAWATDDSDAYASLETKLTTVLGQVATPTGAPQENARVIAQVGDGTASDYYESQPWINYDGTTTIKTIAPQSLSGVITVMVEVLV